jgi:DUF4097 and DUF4098 domain-containing protein YvlB
MAGCSGPDRPAWLSINPNDWSNRSDVDEPAVLEVSGTIAIDVASFNGDVIIEGNVKLKNKAKVTLVREGVHGLERSKDAKAALADIAWTAELVPGEVEQTLQVRTSTTNSEPHFLRAHLYIEAPDINGVTVRTTHGRVFARNVRGAIDVSTTEADVRILTNQAMTNPVTIVSRNGDIDYRVRGDSTGAFDAQTVNGRASTFIKYGEVRTLPPTRNDALRVTLNEGTNPVVLRTVNGDIRIAVVKNPEHVGAIIMD